MQPMDEADTIAADLAESPPTVLCVDDERSILRALQRLLMEEACEVVSAQSGAEALDLLHEIADVALIISDQRMPSMTGVEFLSQAKEIAPQALRVMLTGYADMEATMNAVNQGEIWRYLTKPWDDDALILLVRDALQRYHLEQENARLRAEIEKKNAELASWNERLKQRVLSQTDRIRQKSEELARSNKSLRQSFDQVLNSFVCLLELRDKKQRNHAFNTAAIAANMAQILGLDRAELKDVRAAALLHSIGKLGIDEKILRKPESALDDKQWRAYRQYTVRGETALNPIEELRRAGILIRHLLEFYDGSGTPDGLQGEQIPRGSRIIALAEYLDRRINESGASLGLVLQQVKDLLGTRFDPALYKPLAEAAGGHYSDQKAVVEHARRCELEPRELAVGMMVLRDVYSGTGLLLLQKGSVLSAENIRSLKHYYASDPPERRVQVLVKRVTD
jgi:response regulator RpfG family c-di-GMP phosphodiesterase